MTNQAGTMSPQAYARIAGLLYLIIIISGIWSEAFVRDGLLVPGDAAATVNAIIASGPLLKLSIVADSVMLIADVALAVMFYVLFRPVNRTLSVMAAVFRLTMAAVIAVNLLNQLAVSLLVDGSVYAGALGPDQVGAWAYFFLDMHGHGYDLALIFFGVSCLVLGELIVRSGFMPRILGAMMMVTGVAYLIGSYTLFALPQYADAVAPIYIVAAISESALCLWLLGSGVNTERWKQSHAAMQSA